MAWTNILKNKSEPQILIDDKLFPKIKKIKTDINGLNQGDDNNNILNIINFCS